MHLGHRPVAVIDLLSGKPVTFRYTADGWVHLSQVTFEAYGTRVFAVKHAALGDAIPVWWDEKCTYWRQVSPPVLLAPLAAYTDDVLACDHWRTRTDRDGKPGTTEDWKQPDFDDSAWQPRENGAWNLMDPALANYRGGMRYRCTFTPRRQWQGHRVLLGLYSFDRPIIHAEGTFFVNGHRVTDYKARGWSQTLQYDVTDYLRPGRNVVAIQTSGAGDVRGLTGVVWLAPTVTLAPSLSLAGKWQCVQADGVTRKSITLPGRACGHFLRRKVAVPASWHGCDIFLHVETQSQWLGCINVNGHLITYNAFLHPFGLYSDVNLTPYLRPGAVNRLELWPFRSIPKGTSGPGWGEAATAMELSTIRIGCRSQ
jgi:hypothetical protein